MSFALPWILALGVAAAAGVVALHLLSTQRPPVRPLPTARFVPASELRAVSRSSRPTDLLLLALRVLAVLLIAAAFAQPIPDAPGPAVRRIVALEWTTALADVDATRRRAQALLGEGDALVVFDTAARVVPTDALATLAPPTVRAAALSPMLVAVRDAAATIARGADSLAVTVLGGFPAEAWDAATDALRATWPGRVEVQTLETAVDGATFPDVQVLPADADDPVAAAIATLAAAPGTAADAATSEPSVPSATRVVRLRRRVVLPEDSLWLAGTPGAVLLQWPRDTGAALAPDGVFASLGAEAALVAPLARRELAEVRDGTSSRVVARWRDGAPAVTERAAGQGCLRDVGVGVPERGDVTLRDPFLHWLAVLLEPCGGRRTAPAADALRDRLAGSGPLAVASAFERERGSSPLAAWLLAAALAALVVEQVLRRSTPDGGRR